MTYFCPLCGNRHDTTGCPPSPTFTAPSWWDGKTLRLNMDGTITVDGLKYRLHEWGNDE
jgi:hypothetical protein